MIDRMTPVLAWIVASAFLAAAPLRADELARPSGDVLLTISGAIGQTNAGTTAVFDRAMLEALGPVDVTTSTIWTEGEQVFTGVPLQVLLATVQAGGTTLRVSAINDYSIEIPASDAVADGPIVAYAQNSDPMSVRDKGPLWIIYPFDAKPGYQSEVIYSRSVWQLDRIEIVP